MANEPVSRRSVLTAVASLGVGTAIFHRSLAARAAEEGKVTPEMLAEAEWIAGITLSDEERKEVADAVAGDLQNYKAIRKVQLDNGDAPALTFYAAPPQAPPAPPDRAAVKVMAAHAPERPSSDDDLAFLPVTALAGLVRTRQVSSVELAKLYLARLRRYDERLKCVVTYTDDLALAQAERADREIAAGRYRGPLHGIPWGAKDIISVPGYPTTWGAGHFQMQRREETATVVRRLEEAGAVLVAKLSVGALAMGDEWFGGMTRNPWNADEGSSGSSAGSTAAVVAGLLGFAIGSETLGSIVSPCRRCSATGLRPTYGRVSRHGCMTLSWSMDKLGPIARSVEDCALVLGAIHGADGLDLAAVDRPFAWPAARQVTSLRVGYFESNKPMDERPELQRLKALGVQLVPIELPDKDPIGPLTLILDAEAAAVFDDLTRAGVRDGIGRWATTFRQGQFIPAIEYLRANRVRVKLMQAMAELFTKIDCYVGGDDLVLTNLTGHPTAIVPDGERSNGKNDQPGTITFTGSLFGEAELLSLAHAYQQAGSAHLRRPSLEKLLGESPPSSSGRGPG